MLRLFYFRVTDTLYYEKGGLFMILFTIILIVLLIIAIIAAFVLNILGAGFALIFGDIIVCVLLITTIIKLIRIIKKIGSK